MAWGVLLKPGNALLKVCANPPGSRPGSVQAVNSVAAIAATRNTQLSERLFLRTGADSLWGENGGSGFGLVLICFILPNLSGLMIQEKCQIHYTLPEAL